jgi:hypothetical protein
MKKKARVYKVRSELSGQVITLTVNEELNNLKGKDLAPKKNAKAKKMLKEMEPLLKKILNR